MAKVIAFYGRQIHGEYDQLPLASSLPDGTFVHSHGVWLRSMNWAYHGMKPEDVPPYIKSMCLILGIPTETS